jgi:serine/threonine protein kinase
MNKNKKTKKYIKKKQKNTRRRRKNKKIAGGSNDIAYAFDDSLITYNEEENSARNKRWRDEIMNYSTGFKNLGNGAFGKVVIWTKTDQEPLAVKIINIENNDMKSVENEINTLIYIKSLNDNKCIENILCFKGVYNNKEINTIYLATDYNHKFITFSELLKQIKTIYPPELKNNFDPNQNNYSVFFIKLLSKILIAINFLHLADIVHNDLKPLNILCSINDDIFNLENTKNYIETGVNNIDIKIKIIDFGLSCKTNNYYNNVHECVYNSISGTYEYIDPIKFLKNYINIIDIQIPKLNKNNYNKCDYWGLGIIYIKILILLYDIQPFLNYKLLNYNDEYKKEYCQQYLNYCKFYSNSNSNVDILQYNKFSKIKIISDLFYNYTQINNIQFTKIELLLHPDLSKRKLITPPPE